MDRRTFGVAARTGLAALALASAAGAKAQTAPGAPAPAREDGLSLSGSVRVRYEAIGGQVRPGINAEDELVSVRTTILAEYRKGPFRIGAELYDSRAYGGDAGSGIGTGEVNVLEPVQAYVAADLGSALGRGSRTSLQAGRFMLNLGSRRLVAADEYRNTTNGYTGLRADFRGADGTQAVLIYTLPQVRLPDDPASILDNRHKFDREGFGLQLWGGLVSRPRVIAGAMAELGYFGLAERDSPARPTRNRHLHSVSARLIREPRPSKADFEVEGIYQLGTVRASTAATAPELDVSAWFLHADMGYSFPGPLKARLSIEYDHASGDRAGGSYGRFDTLFGMRRADLAPAGLYNAIGRANISAPGVRLEMAPTPRFDGFITYRAMWLAERTDAFSTTGVRDASGRSGSFAGHQLDGRIRWWAVPRRLRAELNAVWLGKGRFLETAPNAPRTGDTRYVSIALTTVF
jgi:hypothetical protein